MELLNCADEHYNMLFLFQGSLFQCGRQQNHLIFAVTVVVCLHCATHERYFILSHSRFLVFQVNSSLASIRILFSPGPQNCTLS
jgi:hypothetical protein